MRGFRVYEDVQFSIRYLFTSLFPPPPPQNFEKVQVKKQKQTHNIYGTKKITKAELYSIRSNPNSSDKPNTFALEMFTRSKNANRYKMHKKGITWRSIRRRSFWGVVLGGHDGMVSSLEEEGASCPWWWWWSLVVVG